MALRLPRYPTPDRCLGETPAHRLLVIEMLRTSIGIILSARRLGYLDEDLRPTGKPLDMHRQSVKGFQPQLVQTMQDIIEEVEFFESGAATALSEELGMEGWGVRRIMRLLRGFRCPI